MRPTKTTTPRHLSKDTPMLTTPTIARHRKTFEQYEAPAIVALPDPQQVEAGTLPANASELGHKGRGMAGR